MFRENDKKESFKDSFIKEDIPSYCKTAYPLLPRFPFFVLQKLRQLELEIFTLLFICYMFSKISSKFQTITNINFNNCFI